MGDRSEHFPLPAFLYEEYRRAKESPEVVARENAIEAERDRALRDADAESRRRWLMTWVYETPIASENEAQENRY